MHISLALAAPILHLINQYTENACGSRNMKHRAEDWHRQQQMIEFQNAQIEALLKKIGHKRLLLESERGHRRVKKLRRTRSGARFVTYDTRNSPIAAG